MVVRVVIVRLTEHIEVVVDEIHLCNFRAFENARLQLFDKDGAFKRQWRGAKDAGTTGRVFAVAADSRGHYYVGIRREDYDTQHTGVLELDRDWNILTSIGFGQPGAPVFNAVHDIAIGTDGSIYVAETRTKRVVKLRPVK